MKYPEHSLTAKNPELSRFFAPGIGDEPFWLLPAEESRHAVKVLRLQLNDPLELIDGKGNIFTCRLQESGNKGSRLEVLDKRFTGPRSNYRLHLAIAPTKNMERLEWLLEKATEIGLDECTPLICQRSERREVNPDRLQKILAAAMKQCLSTWLPVLHPVTPVKQFIVQSFSGISAIAHCLENEKTELKNLVGLALSGSLSTGTSVSGGAVHPDAANTVLNPASVSQETLPASFLRPVPEFRILIGPEGDFTEAEIESAILSGFKPLSLGNTRLRTETAGLVACTELSMLMR